MKKSESIFDYVEKVFRAKKILSIIGCSIFSVLCFIFAFAIGFSTELDWKISFGSRNSGLGIPVPNFLIALLFIGFGIWMITFIVSFVKSIKSNKEYNFFMAQVKQIGEVNLIDEILSNTEKSPYAKGHLRCNRAYLFYMRYNMVNLIRTNSIRDVRTDIVKEQNGKAYYVLVYTNNKVIQIHTTKKHIYTLANFIRDMTLKKDTKGF